MSGRRVTVLRSSDLKFLVERSKTLRLNRIIVVSATPPRNIQFTLDPNFDQISALFGNGTNTGRVDTLCRLDSACHDSQGIFSPACEPANRSSLLSFCLNAQKTWAMHERSESLWVRLSERFCGQRLDHFLDAESCFDEGHHDFL